MTERVFRCDGITSQQRAAERATGFLRLIRTAPTSGCELHMLVSRCPAEELQEFLGVIQRALTRPRP